MSAVKKVFMGIILAAGYSSRMKDWKPGIKISGVPLIVHTVKPMMDFCKRIVVVGGFNFEKLNKILTIDNYFSKQNKLKLHVIENRNFSDGMFSSVKRGLKEIRNEDGTFIIPGDIPFIKTATYSSLIDNFNLEPLVQVFIPVSDVDEEKSVSIDKFRKGHPVLIRRDIIPDIVAEFDSMNLRDSLEQYSIKLCRVNDKGIFTDVDDKGDLEKINLQNKSSKIVSF